MANGRSAGRGKRDTGRDPGGFVALPWSVLDSAAYLGLSVYARSLLLEAARQYVRNKETGATNNGQILLTEKKLSPRGWTSNDTITKAKRELIQAGFLFETVKGMRPNKAGWYAITWQRLEPHPGYDAGVSKMFEQGAYQRGKPLVENASTTPPHGVEKLAIAPPHGVESMATTPPHGAIKGKKHAFSTPPHGDHLDMPSAGVRSSALAGVPLGLQAVPAGRPPWEGNGGDQTPDLADAEQVESITTPQTLTPAMQHGMDAIANRPSKVRESHFGPLAGEPSIADLAAELAERNAARSKL